MQLSRSNDKPADGQADGGPPDLTDVVGTWFNTNRATGEIVRLDITSQGGELRLRVFGAGAAGPIPWPETVATPFVAALGSREVTGFEAHCDLGFVETHVAANLKYGVLVIQSYNRFKDDSGRASYFTREFFHQHVRHDPAPADGSALPVATAADRPDRDPGGPVDLAELVGVWKNTKRATRVIRELRLRRAGGEYRVHAVGVGAPRDWGEVPVTPHAGRSDARDPSAFHAVYEFGFQRLFLAANVSKGLLIIASYHQFLGAGGRNSYFAREFFYHVSDTPESAVAGR